MATRVSDLLHLHVYWKEEENAQNEPFLLVDREVHASANMVRFTIRSENTTNQANINDDEMIIKVTLTNAFFAKKTEGFMTTWFPSAFSSAFFPPTYSRAEEQEISLQMTDKDRGFTLPNRIDNQPILVENTTRKVEVCFSTTYIPNASGHRATSQLITFPGKVIPIEASSYSLFPHIQVELNESALRQMGSLKSHCYTPSLTPAERAAAILAQTATTAQNAASTALSASQTAVSTAAVVTQNLASSTQNLIRMVREGVVREGNCNIS